MTTLREAAQQALEALDSVEWYGAGSGWVLDANAIEVAITALKAALAEPEPVQEPVAYRYKYSDGFWRFSNGARVNGCDPIDSQALYAAPPQRKPLTEDQIAAAANSVRWSDQYHVDFARAIERAHGIGGSDELA